MLVDGQARSFALSGILQNEVLGFAGFFIADVVESSDVGKPGSQRHVSALIVGVVAPDQNGLAVQLLESVLAEEFRARCHDPLALLPLIQPIPNHVSGNAFILPDDQPDRAHNFLLVYNTEKLADTLLEVFHGRLDEFLCI